MGDAAGKLADRLHLLGVAKGFLGGAESVQRFAFGGDVAADRVDEVLVRDGGPGNPAVGAVLVAVAVLEPQGDQPLVQALGLAAGRAYVFLVDEVQEAGADQLVLGPAEQRSQAGLTATIVPSKRATSMMSVDSRHMRSRSRVRSVT